MNQIVGVDDEYGVSAGLERLQDDFGDSVMGRVPEWPLARQMAFYAAYYAFVVSGWGE